VVVSIGPSADVGDTDSARRADRMAAPAGTLPSGDAEKARGWQDPANRIDRKRDADAIGKDVDKLIEEDRQQ